MSIQYDPTKVGQKGEVLGGVHTSAGLARLYTQIAAGSIAYTSDQGFMQFSGSVWNAIAASGNPFSAQSAAEATAVVTPVNLLYPEGDIRRYAASFGTDDKAAWDKCRAVCTVTGRTMNLAGVHLKFTSAITWDYVKHGIEGQNANLDFTALTGATTALLITTTDTTNYVGSYATPFKNFSMLGPGETSTVDGILFGGGSQYGAFAYVDGFQIAGFQKGMTWGNNSWLNSIGSGRFGGCLWGIYFPTGLSQSGECINFGHILISSTTSNTNPTNGVYCNGGNLHFTGLALDYLRNKYIYAQGGGQIRVAQFHLESSFDNDYWLLCQDSASLIQLTQGDLYNTCQSKTAFPIGQCTNSGAAEINLGEVHIAGNGMTEGKYGFNYVIDGHCSWANWSFMNQINTSGTQAAGPCNGTSLLLDGGFEKTTIVDWLTLDSGTQEVISTAQHWAGAQSMAQAPGAGTVGRAVFFARCEPGAVVIHACRLIGVSIGTDVVYLNINFLDKNGNTISANQISRNITSIPASFTRYVTMPFGRAPVGTAYVQIEMQKRGPSNTNSDGSGTVYYDDCYVWILGPSGFNADSTSIPPLTSLNKTAAYSLLIHRGLAIEGIRIVNSTANAVTGGVKIGTSGGGTQIATAIVVGANADVWVPGAALTLAYPVAASGASTLFIDAVTSFNSASLTSTIYTRRVNSQGF